jgi:hypothetical protein
MEGEVCIRATIKAHKKRHKSMLWLLDSNCESLLDPMEGDLWEIQLVKKITKEDLYKLSNSKKKVNVN